MNAPIRVLHVFDTLDSGGVSNFVMNAYRNIDRTRVQFDFAITSGNASVFDEEAVSMGGRIFYFDRQKSLVTNLKETLGESGPFDAIHSHVFFYSGLVLREAKTFGIPIRIAHAHNAYTGESKSLPRLAYEKAMRFLIRMTATDLLGCSAKACKYVFGNNCFDNGNAVVIPNGIDCDRFAYSEKMRLDIRSELGIEDKLVIGHVGRFLPAKNHEKIICVFSEIYKRRTDAVLLLVGDGPLMDEVKQQAEERHIADKVLFAGAHSNVENMYQAMDAFVFPSRYEGFGMAMIEAQASGLACVASDEVPNETDATGRVAFLPLDADDDVWAEKVLEACEADRYTFVPEAIKRNYSISGTARALEKIYLAQTK